MVDSRTDKLWQRARRYIAANQAAPARAALESILARDPADVRAHLFLSGVHASEDHQCAATRQVQEAAVSPPDDPALLLELAGAAIRVGDIAIARGLLRQPAIITSSSPRVLMSATVHWQLMGENSAARGAIEQARLAGAEGREFHFYRAVQLGFNGELTRSESELERCIALDPPLGQAFVQLAQIRKQTTQSNHLAAIEEALTRVEPDSEDAAALHFARYKELEDLEHYGEAWQALQRGNELMRLRRSHDAAREAATFDRLIEVCRPEFLCANSGWIGGGPLPIFVIGMPRSGTTVLERILGNHSQIESAGELGAFAQAMTWATDHFTPGGVPDGTLVTRLQGVDWAKVGHDYLAQTQWRAHGKAFFVDKLPRNWMSAGLIHKALPQARILHLVRDRMDVCFSNWRAYLGDRPEYSYAYDLDSLPAHYRVYRQVLSHWHQAMPNVILDIDYARLVHDPGAVAREVFEFCGLPDEPGCADLTRNKTPSATLSMSQIRQPIHARSFGEWKSYATQLSGLSAALAAISDV